MYLYRDLLYEKGFPDRIMIVLIVKYNFLLS